MDIGLDRLRGLIGYMASVAADALRKSVKGALAGEDCSEDIRYLSDQLLFMNEEVSELAVELIARFQPVASDLREIKSSIQVGYDFSRIGRYALDICESPLPSPRVGPLTDQLKKISEIVLEMVTQAGEAFMKGDVETAKKVRARDDEVDRLYAEYLESLLREGGKAGTAYTVSGAFILRYLERIADHACYIAGAVIYMRTGKREPEQL